MELLTETFKICKICNVNLPETSFRPTRRMCKCCVTKREENVHKEIMRNYYSRNREALLEYKREYLNNKYIGKERPKRGPKGPRQLKCNVVKQNETESIILCV
jgi:hypothetical protein